jgi:hypothetical protein
VNLSPEKSNYWISDDVAAASDLGALDVGPRLTDAFLGAASNRTESAPARRTWSRLSLLTVAGCLLGVAWLAGSASLYRAATQQVNGQGAETGRLMQSADEDHHAQKADLDAMSAAQNLSTVDTAPVGSAKRRLDATNAESSSGIAAASDAASPSGPKSADRAHTASGQPDPIGVEIAAVLAAAPIAVRKASPRPVAPRRTHDAFDPAKNPNAPGAPRPLGASRTATAMNAVVKHRSAPVVHREHTTPSTRP